MTFWQKVSSLLRAVACGIDQSLKMTNTKRRRKRLLPDKTAVEDDFSHDDDPCDHFKRCVYYPVLDSVVVNLSMHYEAARKLNELSSIV